jgi:peroxiredoxin Q/BCP
MLRDLHSELVQRGLNVAGISPQGPKSHREFREKHALPYTLLADEGKSVITMYEANGPLGIGVRRVTYLVDPARHIRDAVLADFRIARHEDFVRRAIALGSGRG